jgi:hypothetical protein
MGNDVQVSVVASADGKTIRLDMNLNGKPSSFRSLLILPAHLLPDF